MEPAGVAFGRFLRALRERSGFSLNDVATLTEGTARRIDRGSLSRFERGQQRIPLTTLIPLSRLYATDADIILERLELDEELDNFGFRDIHESGRDALTERGRHALLCGGRRWEAYACFREASVREANGEVDDEKAHLNLATVIRSLGKNRLALFEFLALQAGGVRDEFSPIVHERISHCRRCLGDYGRALRSVEAAYEEASFVDDRRVMAFASFARASLALDLRHLEEAVEGLRFAYRLYGDRGGRPSAIPFNPRFEIDTLLRMAEAYLRLGNAPKAARLAHAAKRMADRRAIPAARAHAEIALGETDERTGRTERALLRWRRAGDIATELGDRRLAFGAEFYVFRQAHARGRRALAGASRRRLDRLLPWIAPHLAVVREYEELRGRAVRSKATQSGTLPNRPLSE